MRPVPHPLTIRALRYFGPNMTHAAKWVRAYRWGVRTGKLLDAGAERKWGHPDPKKEAA